MNATIRTKILAGESVRRDWKLGKFLYQGVVNGFPWVAWETRNFGSLLVGDSIEGTRPPSRLRNDTQDCIDLRDYRMAEYCARKMSEQIL